MKKWLVWGVWGWIVAVQAAPAHAVTPQEAQEISRLAEGGNDGAQVLLGQIYLHGEAGYAHDDARAAHWFGLAAAAGNGYAQMMLGDLYAEGKGVARDLHQAALWRQRAAEQNNARAQERLGEMYLRGEGVAPDYPAAEHWLAKAADQGEAHAQYLLARMYRNGCAQSQDLERGRDWLERAAAQGHSGAMEVLNLLREVGEETFQLYREQADVVRSRAHTGEIEAQFELGMRYAAGAGGLKRNPAKALHWLTEAAQRGHRGAMRALAHLYEKGAEGVAADSALAAQWQAKANATPCLAADRD